MSVTPHQAFFFRLRNLLVASQSSVFGLEGWFFFWFYVLTEINDNGPNRQDIKWAREPPLSPRLLDLVLKNARLSARSLCCPVATAAVPNVMRQWAVLRSLRVPQCSFALGKYCTDEAPDRANDNMRERASVTQWLIFTFGGFVIR